MIATIPDPFVGDPFNPSCTDEDDDIDSPPCSMIVSNLCLAFKRRMNLSTKSIYRVSLLMIPVHQLCTAHNE